MCLIRFFDDIKNELRYVFTLAIKIIPGFGVFETEESFEQFSPIIGHLVSLIYVQMRLFFEVVQFFEQVMIFRSVLPQRRMSVI
jgi:hypothetical protein